MVQFDTSRLLIWPELPLLFEGHHLPSGILWLHLCVIEIHGPSSWRRIMDKRQMTISVFQLPSPNSRLTAVDPAHGGLQLRPHRFTQLKELGREAGPVQKR